MSNATVDGLVTGVSFKDDGRAVVEVGPQPDNITFRLEGPNAVRSPEVKLADDPNCGPVRIGDVLYDAKTGEPCKVTGFRPVYTFDVEVEDLDQQRAYPQEPRYLRKTPLGDNEQS